MNTARRATLSFMALVLGAGALPGYYHYVHFSSTTGPWTPSFEKFDLAALPGKTVSFFIDDPADVKLAPTDTRPGLVSHIRAGAKVWNDVATSDLRLAFGGIVPAGTQFNSPVIEVQFVELPPGYEGMGGPEVVSGSTGTFVPIKKSLVLLNKDLSDRPSYSEDFFGTLVHEFGHALGLQHTLASATMSTQITRASSKSKPVAVDDAAGLSVLYPTDAFKTSTGSISGRVSLSGTGMNLASVVAISPNGPTVSSLSLPDGTYQIDGLAAGQYLVYVHPLPPPLSYEVTPANITYPLDPAQKAIPEGPVFETLFYPGVKDAQQAYPVAVKAAAVTAGVDFSVRARGALQLHSVTTYGFSTGRVALKPAYLQPNSTYSFVVATGPGVMTNGAPTPGLRASILRGASLGIKTYSQSAYYAELDIDTTGSFINGDGPRHLLFSSGGDIYILPAAFYQVQKQPPAITGVAVGADANNAPLAVITGTGLDQQSRVLFDGVPGQTRGLDDKGNLLVAPPPAPGAYQARLVALNPDGQSSLFMNAEPPAFAYGTAETQPSFAVTPAAVPAGTDALVTLDVTGMSLADGYASAGFGTADVLVRGLWVVSPTRLLASVSVAGTAAQNTSNVTLDNGLSETTQPLAFTIQPASSETLAMSSSVVNASTGGKDIYPGSAVSLYISGLTGPLANSQVVFSMNDNRVQPAFPTDNQIWFVMPADTKPGPVILKLQVDGRTALPIVIPVVPEPPHVVAIKVNNVPLDPQVPVKQGDVLDLTVTALGPNGTVVDPSLVTINIGGVQVKPADVKVLDSGHDVLFPVPGGVPSGTVNLTVSINGLASAPYPVLAQ